MLADGLTKPMRSRQSETLLQYGSCSIEPVHYHNKPTKEVRFRQIFPDESYDPAVSVGFVDGGSRSRVQHSTSIVARSFRRCCHVLFDLQCSLVPSMVTLFSIIRTLRCTASAIRMTSCAVALMDLLFDQTRLFLSSPNLGYQLIYKSIGLARLKTAFVRSTLRMLSRTNLKVGFHHDKLGG